MTTVSTAAPVLYAATLFSLSAPLTAQEPAPGFRYFGTTGSTETVLVDANEVEVHRWSSQFNPGNAVYLLEDGRLLRSIFTGNRVAPGAGGGIQILRLDGTVEWDFRYDGPGVMAHHDLEPMPNGNVLVIAWEDFSREQAIAAGRDPNLITDAEIFRPDHIIEVRPTGLTTGEIVWEWHVWDHLIQDFDPNQDNYGVVADHPERIDINFPVVNIDEAGDYNHFNCVDYDPIRDIVVLSANRQDEAWIIDHSTTTEEAAGHTGGRYGKGGDLIYRWGNPQAYDRGDASDQQLEFQHSTVIIPPGRPGAGNMTIFNNRFEAGTSAVFEIELPFDTTDGLTLDAEETFGPAEPLWVYSANDFYSAIVSSAERLPNGNTLICSGQQRWVFEVTPEGERVWESRLDEPGVIFHAHYSELSLWRDEAEIAVTGGRVEFDLIAGSEHAGSSYILLAGMSGAVDGLPFAAADLPLQFDLLTLASLYSFNTPVFQRTFSTLDSRGRGRAAFNLPEGFWPGFWAGPELQFSYLVLDETGFTKASSPARVQLRF